MCGPLMPDGIPDPSDGACCPGAALNGPRWCTCWRPVHNLTQADPDLDAVVLPQIPVRMCQPAGDDEGCAYRPGSPERAGAPGHAGDTATLNELVATGRPFWCHAGIRRITRYVHEPTGTVWDPGLAAYDPPVVGNVPYRADGQPAAVCSGWLLRRIAWHHQHADGEDGEARSSPGHASNGDWTPARYRRRGHA
jgi:hypothetical protein